MSVADRELQQEIEQFLYREARLLDDRRFHEWLELLTDDVRYWVPIRETMQQNSDGFHPEGELAVSYMNDNKEFLTLRVERLDTGLAHAETPPSRTRHLITNIEIEAGDKPDEVTVYSNFLLFQSRREHSDYSFFGKREDRLRRVGGEWKLAGRKVFLDQAVLPRGVSILF